MSDKFNKSDSANYFVIDTAGWYTGEAAGQAFEEDKKLSPGKKLEPPQGWYIRNTVKDSLKLKVAGNTEVIMQTLSYDAEGNYIFNEKININKFMKLLSQKNFERFMRKLYMFNIEGNEIVSIKEVYVP